MNIDQLLSLNKTDKINGLLSDNSNVQNDTQNYFNICNKINTPMMSTNQLAFNFLLSNYTNLNTSTNQLGLNSNLFENFFNSTQKQLSSNQLLKNDLKKSNYKDQNLLNNLSTLNNFKNDKKLDENNYDIFINQFTNQNKLTNQQLKKQDQTQLNNQIQHQNLAAAVAACYSNSNLNASLSSFTMDNSKQTNLSSLDKNYLLNNLNDTKLKKNNNLNDLKLNQYRPESENSFNCSLLSNETDFELNDDSIIKEKTEFNNNKNLINQQNESDDSELELNNLNCNRLIPFNSLNLKNGLNETIFIEYQEWAQKTYGDSAKTKTVTKKKYERIVKILNGEEPNNVENSKFRFWVKSKGFRLNSLNNNQVELNDNHSILFVPCIKSSSTNGNNSQIVNSKNKNHSFTYKKVAVVENFFQIIYSVHVEIEGKAGTKNKHAGQKRTYKAVAENWAFLPREAVTRFLASCKDCQKRMHLQINTFQKAPTEQITSLTTKQSKSSTSINKLTSSNNFKEFFKNASNIDSNTLNNFANNLNTIVNKHSNSINNNLLSNKNDNLIKNNDLLNEQIKNSEHSNKQIYDNFNLPLTNSYLSKQINQFTKTGQIDSDLNSLMCNNLNDYLSDNNQLNDEHNLILDNLEDEVLDNEFENNLKLNKNIDKESIKNNEKLKDELDCDDEKNNLENGKRKLKDDHKDNEFKKLKTENLVDENDQISENLNYSNNNEDIFDFKDTKESLDEHDDEEDDDDDNNYKLTDDIEPDKLKAFNMFVRLFIDENLDRSIPISRQPKEKIQAIIDSCKRQFPELQSRARKRIRTYLKSCRRTKKIQNLRKLGVCSEYELKNMNSNEDINQTDNYHLKLNKESLNQPIYHLNSSNAEKILASAFENEILNSYRIKDGLSPLSVNDVEDKEQFNRSSPIKAFNGTTKNPYTEFNSSLINKLISNKGYQLEEIDKALSKFTNNSLENLKIANNKEKSLAIPNKINPTDFSNLNKQFISKNYYQSKDLLSIEQLISSNSLNQLAMDNSKLSNNCSLLNKIKSNEDLLTNLYNLSANELVAIKQLITGYRESAKFFLKSAQELEFFLINQQQKIAKPQN